MSAWQRLVGDRPIVTRLVLAVAAAMAVVLVLASAFVYWRVSFALGRQVDQDLDAYRQVVVNDLRTDDPPPTETPGQTFQVYDDRLRLVDGNQEGERMLTDAQVRGARRGVVTTFDRGRLLPPSETAYRISYERIHTPSGERVVAAAISRRKHDEALRELMLQLAIADLLALLGASFVGYRTARAALDPVELYRSAAARAGAEEPGTRLPVDEARDDELSRLGHTFNDLLDRIEAGYERERQFLADASHELRSPLSLMSTELEWVRHRPRSPEETTKVLDSLQGQLSRLVDLANALLDLEDLRSTQQLRVEEVALPELVADALRDSAGPDADVQLEVSDATVTVDRRWLTMAVANLLRNAVRHGGPHVCLEATVEGPWLTIAVTDDGAGFPPEFADQAFDRFSRAEASRTTPGSGLGLSLVLAVAAAHGGTARIDTAASGGRVELRLPQREDRVDVRSDRLIG
jgi:signal transduction histidine kinase